MLGMKKTIKFYKETLVNDPEVRDMPPESRDCLFADEVPSWSVFKAYSYSACISDCTRIIQMEYCNCSLYNFNPFDNKQFPDCDYKGYLCVEQLGLISSDFQELKKYKGKCNCLPSCTEADLMDIYSSEELNTPGKLTISISMSIAPEYQFRRQVLRTKLDVIVSLGGILGLFLGASILSIIEFIYYFTFRAVNNFRN
ncbi:sodium channel protein Nach-like [Drosophila sulfurigaster albostrigata]|uniref:sodium channel protein Nach-like n=1 Tax=Drosophila sulfurigaster albostrigata TaxID=89887 RepID=UPI002D21B1B2|nr:sodium channel protein Nach-like [Drosophila sulfurigaster albostrigata]XP_062125934.1 sodium channel protein Nach-like [Drosophila sulfurigaster albostrigata]